MVVDIVLCETGTTPAMGCVWLGETGTTPASGKSAEMGACGVAGVVWVSSATEPCMQGWSGFHGVAG